MVELSRHTQLVELASVKVADIVDADTSDHTVDISGTVPPNCIAVLCSVIRASGTGAVEVYPNSGTVSIGLAVASKSSSAITLLPISGQEIKYKNSVSSDDSDLYLHGYIVEAETVN